jgi:SAM-dependent methyltransferase
MLLLRARVWVKNRFPRESVVYRGSRWCFQKFVALREAIARPIARETTGSGIFQARDELPMCSLYPKEILDLALEIFRPRSALDVGCGTGLSLEYFLAHKIDAVGVEGSTVALQACRCPESVHLHDLHEPFDLKRKFDLVWCFEVAEHIHPNFADQLVATLTVHGDQILISAARPGQGGCGHLNEQPPEYWIEKFGQHRFALDTELSARFQALSHQDIQFAENVLVFRRT